MPDECYVPEMSRIQGQDAVNHQASSGEEIEESVWIQGKMAEEQKNVFSNYRSYIDAGTARETARVNLPLSTYTQWYWKMDLHNLFHFLGLRMHPHAQWEMQKYAEAVFELIKPIVPMSCEAFEDYVVDAARFSKKEMEIVKNSLRKDHSGVENLSKREKAEFLKKLGIE